MRASGRATSPVRRPCAPSHRGSARSSVARAGFGASLNSWACDGQEASLTEGEQGRRLQTWLIHGADELNDSPAVAPPVYQTSTFRLRTPEEAAELASQTAPTTFYTRHGTP